MGSGPVVIIGGGLAAANAAESLRDNGFDGPVTILAAEDVRPYERPPLSKAVLAGSEPPAVAFVHEPDWYGGHQIELRLNATAAALSTADHTVTLSDGQTLPFGTAILATGSAARHIPIPGADLAGVHYLRTMADATALQAVLSGGARVAIVGAGWIGLEVASAARGYGCSVTIVEPQAAPLLAAVGPELGAMFAQLHREHDVDLRLSTGAAEIVGDTGRTTGLRTTAGDLVPADVVVVGVGAAPQVALAGDAGIALADGIGGVAVDAGLRTSAPDVFAIGDIAAIDHPVLGQRVRTEHWATAVETGKAVGRAVAGQDVSYSTLPFFFSDQYDLGLEFTGYLGHPTPDGIVYRGSVPDREFIAFYTAGGRVLAGMNVNVWDVSDAIGALVASRAVIDPARLADPDVPLTDLIDG